MSEIKEWAVLILCLICAVVLIAFEVIVVLPLSIITKLAKRFSEKSRDAIARVAEKYKD